MEMEMEEDVVIVGGGIAGLATALALKRVGVRALVLEKAKELRATGAALSLFPNAWLALDALGVAHKLTSIYAPSQKGYITNVATGAIQEVSYSKGNEPRVVHRKALLMALAEELPMDTIRFSSKLTSIETQSYGSGSSIPIIHLEDGTVIKAKVLIGCDGVHSVVARYLGLSAPVNSGRWAVRGLARFPQGHGLNQDQRQFVLPGIRAGFFPLNDKELYWGFSCKYMTKGEDLGAEPELIQRAVLENYAKEFPPSFLDVVSHSDLATVTWAPLMFRVPWDMIFGDLSKGNITVAGDAMHPMTSDLGQGGCSALEDAVVLGRHIGALFSQSPSLGASPGPDEVSRAIESYVKERRWRAATLITGSYLSGWVQQGGDTWWMRFLRDVIFYGLIYRRVFASTNYDCGKLPAVVSSSKFDNLAKID